MGLTEPKVRRAAAQRLELRERILDASRRIVLREGLAALSMRKIADAIGYSPASLYLHFANRDDIVRALGREGHAQLLAHLAPLARIDDPRARLQALAHGYVSYGCEHPQAYRLMFSEAEAAATEADLPSERATSLFAPTLQTLADAQQRRIDSASLACALQAMLHGVVALASRDPALASDARRRQTVDAALDAWFGPCEPDQRDGQNDRESAAAPARKPTKTSAT